MQANSFVIGCGVLLLLLSRCALTAQQFGQYGDFNYRIDGRDVTILEYTRHEPVHGFAVTIPRTIEGLVVRAIGYAFWENYGPTNVTIPQNVTRIDCRAFGFCNVRTLCFEGNAPFLTEPEFVADRIVTVYYLPGKAGWGPTFGGRPTALWKPRIETNDPGFGVQTNRFGFTITWARPTVVIVEACADLTDPVWSPVGTHLSIFSDASVYWSDPQWTNYPTRFYRVRSLW